MTIPSDEHLHAFGAIIYQFASVETGLKIMLSGIVDIDLATMLILTEPLSNSDLKNVVKSIAKSVTWRPGELERLTTLLGDFGTHSRLRNLIAHTRWTAGARPGSIKPRRVDIRNGKPVFYGDAEDERDWTAEELLQVANQLVTINSRILKFNQDTGLADRVTAKLEMTESEIAALRISSHNEAM